MMTAEIRTGHTGGDAVLDPVDLLYQWRNEGRAPLALVAGYAELFLEGNLGTLTRRQHEAMWVIERCCLEAVKRWDEFGDYFRLGCPDKEPLSPTELSDEGLAFLQEHVFKEALASLHTIKEHSDLLLQEELGELTGEQREAIRVISRRSEIAIERWNQPMVYLGRSGRA
jgi:hypothetical protein